MLRALIALLLLNGARTKLLVVEEAQVAHLASPVPPFKHAPTASGWAAAPSLARDTTPRLHSQIRLVSLSDREELYGLTFPVMRRYCAQHGYICDLHTSLDDFQRAPTWYKLPLLQQALRAADPPPEYVLWIDDDILLTALDVPLEWFVYASGFMKDSSKLILHQGDYTQVGLNAGLLQGGTLLVKGGPAAGASDALLQEVWDLGDIHVHKQFGTFHEQEMLELVMTSLYLGLDPATRMPLSQHGTSGRIRTSPMQQLPFHALQSRARVYACEILQSSECWILHDFAAHAYGIPVHQRTGVIHDIGALAGVLPAEAATGPCVFAHRDDMLLTVRKGEAVVVVTGRDVSVAYWMARNTQLKLLSTVVDSDVTGPLPDATAAITQAANDMMSGPRGVDDVAMTFAPGEAHVREKVEARRWFAAYLDTLPQLTEERVLAMLEAMFDKLAHMALLMGRGYDPAVAGGAVYRAVNAFCIAHSLRLVAVSADDTASFAIRADHRIFR